MAYSLVELPKKYKNSLSIINIQNDDAFCFQWSILFRLYPVAQDTNRASIYSMFLHTLNVEGLEFPMRIKDISKFERLYNLNINIFEPNRSVLSPVQINTNYTQSQIDLMLYENHYCPIIKFRLYCFGANIIALKSQMEVFFRSL